MSKAKINQAVKKYLERMREVRGGSPTPESSYYSAPENLINDISAAMGLGVVCNAQVSGAGKFPDFGLFSKGQVSDGANGGRPEFGVIEMKGLNEDVREVAKRAQTQGYLATHSIVAVSNYREFLLLGRDNGGNRQDRDFISIAESEEEFWNLTKDPANSAKGHAQPLADFMRQIPMEQTTLSDPKEIAWLLAMHAQRAMKKLEVKSGGDLEILRSTLEKSLNVRFKQDNQERLFLSTLVQTLFYGLFFSWVRDGGNDRFNWKNAKDNIPIPVIHSLFEQLTTRTNRKAYGLDDILERAAGALNRIDRPEFFVAFKEDEAIQHFYELFLHEFDPKTRREKGVWYTPRKIVKYMVDRVDNVLRTELGYKDGLADKGVYVLDPCCGTGAYVLEVLRKIEKIQSEKKLGDAVTAEYVREAAAKRVFGFEIMAAPLVIAHYQVGDFLREITPPSRRKMPASPTAWRQYT